ncbi:SH3 domain-containing protein [Flagellimonas onchidii]|uniref:SH3 domain-containing protein n=1 Tax=Flagellimonas onchidii TaxID=2562684 RepID=UPI0010A632F1|nr:SH3 domain-containing protein [Allomuricauda onchidii]
MKSIIPYIFFIFQIVAANSQESSAKPYYIWAKSGLSLRESPSANAEKITIIPYKSEVSIISDSGILLTVTEFPGFDYTDNWVKIKYKDFIGYSFMGYLSTIKPPELHENYPLLEYLNDSFSKIDTHILSRYEDCTTDDDHCISSGVASYKEGISYSFFNEGGFSGSLSIPNFNILQAFTLATIFCPSYKDFETKYFETPLPTIMVFRDDVGCDFSITVLGDFTIIHWTAGC